MKRGCASSQPQGTTVQYCKGKPQGRGRMQPVLQPRSKAEAILSLSRLTAAAAAAAAAAAGVCGVWG
jgi:hypothetical protein